MTSPSLGTLTELLLHHEGLCLKPYRCTAGKLTIGVGRNLDDQGITRGEAMVLLNTDITSAEADVKRAFSREVLLYLAPARWAAITDMMFNLGMNRFLGFVKFREAIQRGDWTGASLEMLDSKWAAQVGRRAIRLSDMIRTGEWPTR